MKGENIKSTLPHHKHASDASIVLTTEDRDHVKQFNVRLALLRDRVRSVTEHYQTGALIIGRPGTSKTFTVCETLDKMNVNYVYRNNRMTARGLFEEMSSRPEHLFVLDDIPTMLADRQSQSILMAALDGSPEDSRPITYVKNQSREVIQFSGGIIALSNVPLRHDPLAQAIASRVVVCEHQPTDQELAAKMRSLAAECFDELTPEESRNVVEFVINESRKSELRLDLRFMTKAVQDYQQAANGDAVTPWRELVRSSMQQVVRQSVKRPRTKTEDIELQRERVQRVIEDFPDDRDRQIETSGLSRSTFYNRLAEIQE